MAAEMIPTSRKEVEALGWDYIDIILLTSRKEVEALGWDYIDIILFSGDAYVDHPSFGTAVIARWLQKHGYRVAVVPQPNWRDDLRDFRKLGRPRLYFGVNAGAMDSMVNHYTASKRLRSDDAYTPDGKAGQRPDYAVTVYTNVSPITITGKMTSCRLSWYRAGPTGSVTGWGSARCSNSQKPSRQDATFPTSAGYRR